METAQVQRDAVPMSKLRRLDKGSNATSTAVQSGDAFAAIFEMMAQSLQQGNNFLSPAAGDSSTLTSGVQQTADGTQKAGNSLMQQLAGALLAQNPQLAAFLRADDTQAQQMLSSLKLPADVQQMMLSLRQTMAAELGQQTAAAPAAQTAVQTSVQGAAENTAAVQQTAVQGSKNTAESTNSVQNQNLSTLKGEASAEEQPDTVLQAVNQFVQNVREAKKLMNNPQQKSNQSTGKDEIDVDALQNHAQASRPTINAAALKSVGDLQTQTADLTSQIKKGIAENLLTGKQDFVIKLKPDGLGEITVKLTEKAGEATTLHLLTANAETARLINSDLDSLKDAMRPLQVVVESAQSQQTGNGSEQTGQQMTQQQQFNAFAQHSGNRHNYYGLQYSESDDAAQEAASTAEVQNESILNSYI